VRATAVDAFSLNYRVILAEVMKATVDFYVECSACRSSMP
jgi:hypothetical protein